MSVSPELSCVVEAAVGLRRIRPTLYEADPSAFDSDHAYLRTWKWVQFSDLASLLCGLVIKEERGQRRTGPSVSALSEFLDRFGLVCGHTGGKEVLTWVTHGSYAAHSSKRPPEASGSSVFLPSGFCDAVISLAEVGIVRVTSKGHPTGTCVDGEPAFAYSLVAHHIDGARYELLPAGPRGQYTLGRRVEW